MREDALINELASRASQGDSQATARVHELMNEVVRTAEAHERVDEVWRAVALLGRARAAIAPRPDLDRRLAATLWTKADRMLRWARDLGVRPSEPLLEQAASDLTAAVATDPTLSEAHWDLAVVAGFRGDRVAVVLHAADARSYGSERAARDDAEEQIAARTPVGDGPDTPDAQLRRLLLELADQAAGPGAALLRDGDAAVGRSGPSDHIRTLDQYVAVGERFATAPQLSVDDMLAILGDSEAIVARHTEVSDYVADLLRRLAEARAERDRADTRFLDRATTRHLQILHAVIGETVARARASGDATWATHALRTARRALAIVDASPATVDHDLHAELLLAEGGAHWVLDERRVIETIASYRKALRLKRLAGNQADVARLISLFWTQIDSRARSARRSELGGGIGEELVVLEACADAADDLDDPDRALRIRLDLGALQRVVSQYDDAAANLERVIGECSRPGTVEVAKAELASVYTEIGRPADAAALLEELLGDGPQEASRRASTLWSHYANSLRLLGRLPDARDALHSAWALLPANEKETGGAAVHEAGARIKLMTAQVDHLLGDDEEALARLAEAETLSPDPTFGVRGLHFHRTRAEVLLGLGRTNEALVSLEHADALRRFILRTGPSYTTWENMLRHWSGLDVSAVRALIAAGGTARHQKALLRAEAAKGRVTAWLEHAVDSEAAEHALDPARQAQALDRARSWLDQAPGRRLVSLFASDEGLAVFDVRPEGDVAATWIDAVTYDAVLSERYEPWERSVKEAMERDDPDLDARANAMTEALLDDVGAWLDDGVQALDGGGEQLVIVPHRLFRGLPLLHARLPSGARLSERFASVVVAPTLAHLAAEHGEAAVLRRPDQRVAVADADLTLPFARCEALLAAATDRCHLGQAATTHAVMAAFRQPAFLVLSMHGAFDAAQPFRSRIFAADGPVELGDLTDRARIDAHTVLLGICETGRSRRSVSDEPWGFPTLLLQAGARTVVAPSWPVDDFASFLLVTYLVDEMDDGLSIERALVSAAAWLRELTAEQIGPRLDWLLDRLRGTGGQGRAAARLVAARVEEQRAWVDELNPTDRPFGVLDWAAFQVHGAVATA